MHTGMHPMKTTFRLFLDWGITFGEPFTLKENAARKVEYAGREELFQEIWGTPSVGDIATVTVHIKKLREKIEEDTSNPEYIETIWGVGYRFRA